MSRNEEREIVRDENAEDKDEVEGHVVRDQLRESKTEEDREATREEPDFEAHRKH